MSDIYKDPMADDELDAFDPYKAALAKMRERVQEPLSAPPMVNAPDDDNDLAKLKSSAPSVRDIYRPTAPPLTGTPEYRQGMEGSTVSTVRPYEEDLRQLQTPQAPSPADAERAQIQFLIKKLMGGA
jgi:hypothetical protein